MDLLRLGLSAVENGIIPDRITRIGIRRLCANHLKARSSAASICCDPEVEAFIQSLDHEPIAPLPHKANEQHYELPPEFFERVLGRHRKYSCCLWLDKPMTLDEAEESALEETCRRGEITDGQRILELGCGWGSLSLWMAEHYPNSRITAISNSATQRRYIEEQIVLRRLNNLRVLTVDMNDFANSFSGQDTHSFDRIVSVEMFEHMRNYRRLLSVLSRHLTSNGKMFIHIFCHRYLAYPFESEGSENWMGRHFFSGGMMPSADLLRRFDENLRVTKHWVWNGEHYKRTAEAWLDNFDMRQAEIMPILQSVYGIDDGRIWFHRWRIFFLAVQELFGYSQGEEWFVSHYLLEPAR